MATSKKRAAEIQAGFVVVIALAILAAGLYWVGGGAEKFKPKTDYTVYFANVGGLKSGNAVELDGRRVGKVKEVRAARDSERPATIIDRESGPPRSSTGSTATSPSSRSRSFPTSASPSTAGSR
ncbi:MAG: MlaD family protein [Planctomycetota bacterium]|jgi:ABC-type transporter Mla subunit MlaD